MEERWDGLMGRFERGRVGRRRVLRGSMGVAGESLGGHRCCDLWYCCGCVLVLVLAVVVVVVVVRVVDLGEIAF